MKTWFFGLLILAGVVGCERSENFGYTPPPETQEERKKVYGDSAPEYPTMTESVEKHEQD